MLTTAERRRLDAFDDLVHDYGPMAKNKTNKLLAGFMVAVGIVLLGMYAVLMASGGRPSVGMLVVGLVDLIVGIVLLGRARSSGAAG